MTDITCERLYDATAQTPPIDRSGQYLGSLSLTDSLDSFGISNDTLGFYTAHVFSLDAHEQPRNRLFEIRLEGEPLRGQQFLDLLNAIAPTPLIRYSEESKALSILADWVIYEAPNDVLRDLADRHSALKGWDKLGREYPDLKAALEPVVASERPLPWMLPGNDDIVKPAKFMMSWGNAKSLANHEPLIETPDLLKLLAEVYGPDFARPQIILALKYIAEKRSSELEQAGLRGLSEDELFSAFLALDITKRNQLVSVHAIQSTYRPDGITSWAHDDRADKFTALYLQRHCVTFMTEDGQTMYAHGLSPDENISQAYASRQKIYLPNTRPRYHTMDRGTAYECEIMELDTIIGRQSIIIPGSVKFHEGGLIPAIRWAVAPNGRRTHQELPEHPPLTSYKQNVLSGVAGLAILAYLQPNKYGRWKPTGRLPDADDDNDIGPAQVPLRLIQNARQLLNYPLLTRAEQLRIPA